MPTNIEFSSVESDLAAQHLDELATLYAEVYAEPPYEYGQEHVDLFAERFARQCQRDGFRLIEAREHGQLVGIGFGLTLLPSTPWWQNLNEAVDEDVIREHQNRTFAVIELLVRRPWRRRHIAEEIHSRLLNNRTEERATLTVLPAAEAAQSAYRKWGWQRVAQKRNPLPGSPMYDVMLKKIAP